MRIALWVRPGSARPGVGGEHNGALVVRVSAPAVGGQATEAALTAVAAALGVRRHAVTLIAGAASRTKIVESRAPARARSTACPPTPATAIPPEANGSSVAARGSPRSGISGKSPELPRWLIYRGKSWPTRRVRTGTGCSLEGSKKARK